MKRIVTTTIAAAGLATIAFAGHDARAAEQNNNGYNSNDAQSYSYAYTVGTQDNYHYTWTGNWNPGQLAQNNTYYYNGYNTYGYNGASYNNYYSHSYRYNNCTNNGQTATNNYYTGGSGASYGTTSNNIHVTIATASSSNGRSIPNGCASGSSLYASGQCTYYVFDRVDGKIGSTWGNASNWANAAASSGYAMNNTPKVDAIMQTAQSYYSHVAYVEGVNSNGSVRVSEMNYGHGAGMVTSHVISANQAGSYSFTH